MRMMRKLVPALTAGLVLAVAMGCSPTCAKGYAWTR
jgi:hypothetical protein